MYDAQHTIFLCALLSVRKHNLCSKSPLPQAVMDNELFSGLRVCWTVLCMGFVWLCSCVRASACNFACP